MKNPRVIAGLILGTCLAFGGCSTVPMTYSEWQREQEAHRQAIAAGIPYKSPSEVRKEAVEMRQIAREAEAPDKK